MKIICSCGYESNLQVINNELWDNPETVRKGYEILENHNEIYIDSQYMFCYIICGKCGKNFVLST